MEGDLVLLTALYSSKKESRLYIPTEWNITPDYAKDYLEFVTTMVEVELTADLGRRIVEYCQEKKIKRVYIEFYDEKVVNDFDRAITFYKYAKIFIKKEEKNA